MPKLTRDLPQYCRSRKKYACVRIGGRNIHLGKWESPESHQKYNRVVGEWLTANRSPAAVAEKDEITVNDCVAAFALHLKDLYKTATGRRTGTAANYRPTLDLVIEHYGFTPAEEFGPLSLLALRDKLVEQGLARNGINEAVGRIVRLFQFAVSRQLVPESVWRALTSVEPLRRFEKPVPERVPVEAVADEIVEKTLPFLPKVVADMVRFQRLTGARSGEIVQMRPCDIDRTKKIWRYTPREHKTERYGVIRVIAIGRQAQEILQPYLNRPADCECFSPEEAWADRSVIQTRRHKPGSAYSNNSYRRAISRACELAFGMPKALRRAPTAKGSRKPLETAEQKADREELARIWRAEHCWHPHQLRHAAATRIAEQFDEHAANATLGHTRLETTAEYAKRQLAKKKLKLQEKVARAMG